MVNLPQDVLIDILARLPVKSVIRFRCVCKSWRSLISEPHFVKAHLDRSITGVNVGYQKILLQSSPPKSMDYEALQINGDNAACITSLDFLTIDPEDNYFLFASESCNGMVCIVVNRENIILFNPCTRDVKELPNPSSISLNYGTHGIGLGYDSSVDDYKVVIAVPAATLNDEGEVFYSGEIQVEVYSLRNNSWRRLPDINRKMHGFFGGALLNGVLHWLARIGKDMLIISFDFATEKFHELLPLPPNQGDNNNNYFWNLNVLGGYLSIDCHEYYVKHDIWVMKEYGLAASWTKLFTIREDNAPFHNDYYLRPVCFTKNGDVLVDVDCRGLIIYNWKEDTSDLVFYDPRPDWHEDLVVYSETLVSPNCYG